MNDCSWMYREYSPKGLYMKNYCKRVEGFINFTLLNLNNISGDEIRCPCTKCKNKKFHQSNVVMMHLLKKKGLYENTYVGLHKEKYMFLIKPC